MDNKEKAKKLCEFLEKKHPNNLRKKINFDSNKTFLFSMELVHIIPDTKEIARLFYEELFIGVEKLTRDKKANNACRKDELKIINRQRRIRINLIKRNNKNRSYFESSIKKLDDTAKADNNVSKAYNILENCLADSLNVWSVKINTSEPIDPTSNGIIILYRLFFYYYKSLPRSSKNKLFNKYTSDNKKSEYCLTINLIYNLMHGYLLDGTEKATLTRRIKRIIERNKEEIKVVNSNSHLKLFPKTKLLTF